MLRLSLLFMAALSTTGWAQSESRFGIGAQLGVHGGIPVSGAEVTMPVNENLQLSYAFVQGRTDLSSELNTTVVPYISKANASFSEGSVSMRWFFTQSFYAGAGTGYRSLDLDIEGIDVENMSTFDGKFNSEALQLKAMIGNSWSFSNGFYLGVDWVGLGTPIMVTQSTLRGTETDLTSRRTLLRTEENDSDYKSAARKVGHATVGTLLTLRLGFNF